jgi:uncharacterized membrane protein
MPAMPILPSLTAPALPRPFARAAAGAALMAPLLPAVAHAGLEVCNQTNVNRWLAVGYHDEANDSWTSEGWWELEPGSCATPIEGDLTKQFYYYRAEDPNEEFEGEDYVFCTVDDAFTIVGDQDCEARGYETGNFREVDTGEVETTYTLILNPTTVPGALAMGEDPPASAEGGLEVCNQTNVNRWLAIGYFDGSNESWTSEGWWELEPGDCTTPVEGALTQQYYYYRAEDPNEQFEGDPDYLFCTVNDAFTIVGDQDCEARNYITNAFLEVDTGETATSFTLDLTPQTVPGAQAIGEQPAMPPAGAGANDQGQIAAADDPAPGSDTAAASPSADAAKPNSPFGAASDGGSGGGNLLAETYQGLLGDWINVDNRAMKITFRDDVFARYDAGALQETGTFEVAEACPGATAQAGGPIIVVRLPGLGDPVCHEVLFQDSATLELLDPDGSLLRFETAAR